MHWFVGLVSCQAIGTVKKSSASRKRKRERERERERNEASKTKSVTDLAISYAKLLEMHLFDNLRLEKDNQYNQLKC